MAPRTTGSSSSRSSRSWRRSVSSSWRWRRTTDGPRPASDVGALDELDMSRTFSKKEGKKELKRVQTRLVQLRLTLGGLIGDGELGPPVCAVFEGHDASGKGG